MGVAPNSCAAPIERNYCLFSGVTGPLVFGQTGPTNTRGGAGTTAVEDLCLGTLTTDFTVGNPRETPQTVALVVRPVQLPLGWTYRLSTTSLALGAGQTATVTLTVDVGHTVPEDSLARLSVEDYLGSDLIGGIL